MTTLDYTKSFDLYLQSRRMSENTIKIYLSIVKKFLGHFKIAPSNITSNQVQLYTIAIKNGRTRNQTIGCLKTFFAEIVKRPNIVRVPYAKVDKKTPIFISKERFDLGMSECSNPKHRLMFLLMFSHGLRIGEVINCKISWFGSQVVDGKKQFTINVTGKGSKDRLLWLSPQTINELIDYSKRYNVDLTQKQSCLFTGQNKSSYSRESIGTLTHKYFNVNPHALRHSCATELVNKDVNQKKIQDLLGHSSGKTTEIYTHTSIKSMIDVCA